MIFLKNVCGSMSTKINVEDPADLSMLKISLHYHRSHL